MRARTRAGRFPTRRWLAVLFGAYLVVATVGLGVIGVIGVGLGYLVSTSKYWDQGEREVEGERIVLAVESFRREHGRLPATLAEAGVEPDPAVFDRVSYSAVSSEGQYSVSCSRHGWAPGPCDYEWCYDSRHDKDGRGVSHTEYW